MKTIQVSYENGKIEDVFGKKTKYLIKELKKSIPKEPCIFMVTSAQKNDRLVSNIFITKSKNKVFNYINNIDDLIEASLLIYHGKNWEEVGGTLEELFQLNKVES